MTDPEGVVDPHPGVSEVGSLVLVREPPLDDFKGSSVGRLKGGGVEMTVLPDEVEQSLVQFFFGRMSRPAGLKERE
jgi:hypothetical protein